MHQPRKNQQAGMALIIAMIFIAVSSIVLGALTIRVVQQNGQALQYKLYNDTFTGLDAAVAESWYELEAGQDGKIGMGTWTAPPGATRAIPSFDDTGLAPESSSALPTVQYIAFADNWETNGIDDNGDGSVDDASENFTYTIYASSQNRGLRRNVEVVIRGFDVNVWRNAIFAGAGQAGGLINGNVSIHGSVHLLGDNVLTGATVLAAIDLSGTSLIHNNYVGLPAALASRIPPLETVTFGGETVETLRAKLRVKHGLVGMSGNSEIGEANITGNSIKETMDGTHVNDGWTGTSVNDDGDRGDPTNVWSDNGWDEAYDVGEKVPMPYLSHDYKELGTGATYVSPSTLVNYTHSEYFEQVLASTPYPGNMTIRANQNFYYNATRPGETDPSLRQATDDYILFNATTNLLQTNGQVQINGDLTITRGAGNDKSINYTGRAALLARGNVTLDTDLLAVNADGTTANSFPANNIIGIMAEHDFTVGSLSQLTLMGAFYAQGTVHSSKQTTTLGTFVGTYFDMGTNVPEIFQVPELADNLPLGMIGAYPILVFDQVSWRELGT